MDLQWLVFFPGRPSRDDWRRVDASARIARAALQRASTCHIIFEDRISISLSPAFLGERGAWDGTEASYEHLLKDIANEKRVPDASFRPRTQLAELLRDMLKPADVALDFRENGALVMGPYQEGSIRPRSALCVIGGVKDLHEEETKVLTQVCKELKKTRLCVSLGSQAELTSKCMKAVGELNRQTAFSNAVSHWLSSQPAAPLDQNRVDRPRLHLIVMLPPATSLLQFFEQRGTATMVVDAFVNSHGVFRNTWLSFLTATGDALTIQGPGGKCLAEADAINFLKEKLHTQSPKSLTALLKESQKGGQRVLVADESRTLLQRMDRADKVEDPVAVVFPSRESDTNATIDACVNAGVLYYGCAAVGGVEAGIAYVNVRHSAGMLGRCLANAVPRRAANRATAKPAQALCPSVSLTSRLPPNQRPKGSGRPAPWAAAACAGRSEWPAALVWPEEASSSSAQSEARSQGCDALPTPTTDPGNTILSMDTNGAEHLEPSDAAPSSAEPEEKLESPQPSD